MFDVSTPTHQYTQSMLQSNWSAICDYQQKIRKQDRPYASQAGFCHRQAAMRGILPDTWESKSGSLPFYAEIGRAVEKIAVAKYKKAGQVAAAPFKLPEQFFDGIFNVGGEIDLITNIDGTLGIFDIKTVGVVERSSYVELSSQMLTHLVEHDGIIITTDEETVWDDSTLPAHSAQVKENSAKKPYPSYLAQIQMYCAITGIDDGWLQFISRRIQDTFSVEDTSPSTHFYAVPLDEDTLVKRIAMLIYGIRCRDENTIPQMPKGIKKSHCSSAFCPFIDFCYNGVALHELHDYGRHHSTKSIKLITPEQSVAWRSEALRLAKKYIANRPERANMLRELLKLPRQ